MGWDRGARRARWQRREGNAGKGEDGRGQKGKMAVAGLVGAGGGCGQMAGGSGGKRGIAGSLGQGGPDGRGWQGAAEPDGSCWRWWGRRVVGQDGQMAGAVGAGSLIG